MKAQSSIEYLIVFAAAVLILTIVLVILSNSASNVPPTPSQCYLSPQLNCQQLIMASNPTGSEGILVFTNGAGQTIHLPQNSFVFEPSSSGTTYTGNCLPTNAIPGTQVVCIAYTGSYSPKTGT